MNASGIRLMWKRTYSGSGRSDPRYMFEMPPGEPPIAHFLILARLDMTVTNQSRVLRKIQLIEESFVFGGIVRFVFGGRQLRN